MPRATSPHSESESERVPSKKQKKREESPADDPMDEDGEDEAEAEKDDEEYEIAAILDSSEKIFKDVCFICLHRLRESHLMFLQGEMAYFVSWKGYSDAENSWVRESDAPYVFFSTDTVRCS